MNIEILTAAENLVSILKQRNLKLATAESCTGGMISSYITAVSGASKVFEMGLTTYSNRIKSEILKVRKETLDTVGAVSYDTAKQMAQNICTLSGADIGISATGVAGPDSQDGYPAGTVFIGICYNGSAEAVRLDIKPIDRNYVREQTVLSIFKAIIKRLA